MSEISPKKFVPSPELVKLQKKLIEMLEIASKICDKYKIPYYLMHGGLIGAVRNGGMIPWDDDIDIAIPRKFIKPFAKACKKELSAPYFLQYQFTDKNYDNGFLRLRDSNTTAICTYEWNRMQNERKYAFDMGIFLDIYPIDNIPADKKKLSRYMKFIGFSGWFMFFYHAKKVNKIKQKLVFPIFKVFRCIVPYRIQFLPFHFAMQLYDLFKTEYVGYTWSPGDIEKHYWKREWFAQTKTILFEGLNIKIPSGYDNILRQEYGDYMTPVMNAGNHSYYKFDTEHPYTEYIPDNVRKEIRKSVKK